MHGPPSFLSRSAVTSNLVVWSFRCSQPASCVPSLLQQVESLLDDADLSVELSREKFESLNDELFTR